MTPEERATVLLFDDKDAFIGPHTSMGHYTYNVSFLAVVAAIRAAVEAEREACALIAAETGRTWVEFFDGDGPEACRHIAQAIRERGT